MKLLVLSWRTSILILGVSFTLLLYWLVLEKQNRYLNNIIRTFYLWNNRDFRIPRDTCNDPFVDHKSRFLHLLDGIDNDHYNLDRTWLVYKLKINSSKKSLKSYSHNSPKACFLFEKARFMLLYVFSVAQKKGSMSCFTTSIKIMTYSLVPTVS